MFRFFERLVDAFGALPTTTPPATFWAYMADHLRPFRRVLGFTALTGLVTALVETGLIFYAGRVVDLLAEGPDGFASRHGLELLLIATVAREIGRAHV